MARKNIMREIRIDRIAGVDIPAQEGALALIQKRHSPDAQLQRIQKYMSAAIVMTGETDGHQHGIGIDEEVYDRKGFYVGYGYTADGIEHFHPITSTPAYRYRRERGTYTCTR